jgi:hypothetical protein
MKLLIITALLHCLTFNASAQISIADTRWDARTTIPQSIDLKLEFSRDSFSIYRLNGKLAETSYFLQKNDSLFIRKLWGVSPCSSGYEAWYNIEWLENGNKFILHSLSDTCRQRANSWTSLRINGKINK